METPLSLAKTVLAGRGSLVLAGAQKFAGGGGRTRSGSVEGGRSVDCDC